MITQLRNTAILNLLLVVVFASVFTSCDSDADNELIDVENFTDGSIERLQSGAVGKSYCLEFIFPITISFVDETTSEVESYVDLHETIVAWFEINEVEKTRSNKPSLVFPLQVLNTNGDIVDVESKEALSDLKDECPKSGKSKGKKGRGFSCFTLQFPVTISIGGVDTSFDDKPSLKAAVRAYKEEAGEDAERPSLVYPVTVIYEDESTATVTSQEELEGLKEACQEDE